MSRSKRVSTQAEFFQHLYQAKGKKVLKAAICSSRHGVDKMFTTPHSPFSLHVPEAEKGGRKVGDKDNGLSP